MLNSCELNCNYFLFTKLLWLEDIKGIFQSSRQAATIPTQPFYVRFCNGDNENFQHHIVKNAAYGITKARITNLITIQKSS